MRRSASEIIRNLEARIARLERQASKVDLKDSYLMRVFKNQVSILTNENVNTDLEPFEMSRGGKIVLEVPLKGNKAVKVSLDSWSDESMDTMSVGKVYRKSSREFEARM